MLTSGARSDGDDTGRSAFKKSGKKKVGIQDEQPLMSDDEARKIV